MEVVNEIRHQSFKDAVVKSATTHADDCLSYEFYSESGSRVMLKSSYQIDPENECSRCGWVRTTCQRLSSPSDSEARRPAGESRTMAGIILAGNPYAPSSFA